MYPINYYAERTQLLKNWIKTKKDLPQTNTDVLLARFLISCNESIEVSKNLIEYFYSYRSKYPEIFDKRDLYSTEIQESIEIIDLCKLPESYGNSKIMLMRINTSDVAKFHFLSAARMFTIFDDIILTIDQSLAEGDICLLDLYQLSLKHIPRLSLSVAKKMFDYMQEARPTNLKQIHCLNVPSYIETLITIFKPFVKSEIFDLIKFHLPNSTTLYDFVPKELLPEEYGGSCGKVADLKKELLEVIIKHQNIISDESYWAVQNSKRPTQTCYEDKNSVQGSFKKLEID